MSLSAAEIAHVARLARLQLDPQELERMRVQVSAILDHVSMLQEVDVSGIEPTAQVTGLTSVLRPDAVVGALSREDVLTNAPDQAEGMFRVRAVFDE